MSNIPSAQLKLSFQKISFLIMENLPPNEPASVCERAGEWQRAELEEEWRTCRRLSRWDGRSYPVLVPVRFPISRYGSPPIAGHRQPAATIHMTRAAAAAKEKRSVRVLVFPFQVKTNPSRGKNFSSSLLSSSAFRFQKTYGGCGEVR